MILPRFQLDPDRRSFVDPAVFDEDLALVVILDDAFGEAQTETPAAFFGTVPRPEDIIEILHLDPAAVVRDVETNNAVLLGQMKPDLTVVAVDRVHGILDDVLHDPTKELGVDIRRRGGLVRLFDRDGLAQLRHAAAEILREFRQQGNQVVRFKIRRGTDLGKTRNDAVKALNIDIHLVDDAQGRVPSFRLAAEEFRPAHERRQGRAQLVRRLFGHPNPDGALFAPLDIAETDVTDENERADDPDLDDRQPRQLADQLTVRVVMDIAEDRILIHDRERRIIEVHFGHEFLETLFRFRGQCVAGDVRDIPPRKDRAVGAGIDDGKIDTLDDLIEDEAVFALGIVLPDTRDDLRVDTDDVPGVVAQTFDDVLCVRQYAENDDQSHDKERAFEIDHQLVGVSNGLYFFCWFGHEED